MGPSKLSTSFALMKEPSVPKRDSAPIGAPCWVDLFTSDPDTSKAFYGRLFGWTAEDAGEEYGGYITFSKDGVPVAGGMRNDGRQGMPDVWSVYLATDDAKATVEAAEANGGGVIVPAMDVGELGSMAVVTDAGQAAIGIWQPGLHRGFGLIGEPGAPAWFQLSTRDYEASVRFYREVFRWDTHVMSDSAELRYTTLGEGDTALAGIMDSTSFLPDGVPAYWSVIFAVEDTDAALATIVDLGGSVVRPAADTPYGRLAQAADPTGAQFDIISQP
jgi:predicted enzyme related to lactoylglutathione lyase